MRLFVTAIAGVCNITLTGIVSYGNAVDKMLAAPKGNVN
jgi:hypothetical protein